ncbi:hypothetical protein D3C78_1559270 [compost metagenome]
MESERSSGAPGSRSPIWMSSATSQPAAVSSTVANITLIARGFSAKWANQRSSGCSFSMLRWLCAAADLLTPVNESSTGSKIRLVKISTATPILAAIARP